MPTERPVLTSCMMLAGASVYCSLATSFLFVLRPAEMDGNFLSLIKYNIDSVIYLILTITTIMTVWLIFTFAGRRVLTMAVEIGTIFLLLAAMVPLFGLAYLLNGLKTVEAVVAPSSLDAFHFSILTFVGVDHPDFAPSNDSQAFYIIESFVGYFVTPLLVALALMIVERPAQKH